MTMPLWVDRFLRQRRVGVLALARIKRTPLTTPVWYEWSGQVLRIVVESDSAKARLVARHAEGVPASVTVQSEWPPYRYVVMHGTARIVDRPPGPLRKHLARRYFGLVGAASYLAQEAQRGATDDTMRVLEIAPQRVDSHDFHPEAGLVGRLYFAVYRRLRPLRP